jgi:outer membrane lipoprotein-sorting protein
MRARLLVPLSLLALVGCSLSKKGDDPAQLLADVRAKLSARDAKLGSYRIAGTLKDEGADALAFTFDYRAPQRMRASLPAPVGRTFAWDGEHLFERSDSEKRFTTFTSELPADKRAGFLTETFAPFTPEGFRAPLLLRSATVRRASHPKAKEAVELAMTLEGAAGGGMEVVYVLRWPALDFVAKRTRTPDGAEAEVRVEEEHCEEALGLCVPRKLTRWVGGRQVGETVLSKVELSATLPNDTFTLQPPEGYAVQTRTLVDSGAKPPSGG